MLARIERLRDPSRVVLLRLGRTQHHDPMPIAIPLRTQQRPVQMRSPPGFDEPPPLPLAVLDGLPYVRVGVRHRGDIVSHPP